MDGESQSIPLETRKFLEQNQQKKKNYLMIFGHMWMDSIKWAGSLLEHTCVRALVSKQYFKNSIEKWDISSL